MKFLKTLLFGCCLLGFANVKATEQFVKIEEPIILARGETYSICSQTIACNSNIESLYNKQQPNTMQPICFKPIIFGHYDINESYCEVQPLWTDIPQRCSNPEPDTSIPVRSENTEPWKDNEKLFSDLKFEDYDQSTILADGIFF